MIQQYLLLRNENDLLNSLIGQSFNQKSKFEAEKILDEIHSKAESRLIGKKALCYVVDKNEILGVGGSTLLRDKHGKIVSNLILDNFGLLLAGLFNGFVVPAPNLVVGLTNDSGGATNILMFDGNNWNSLPSSGTAGAVHKVGSGTTAPDRTDFDIETAFGSAPESGDSDSSDPVFVSALGRFKSVSEIIAGGAGTIRESVLKIKTRNQAGGSTPFTYFRDIISPEVPFVAGNIIILEYTMQL